MQLNTGNILLVLGAESYLYYPVIMYRSPVTSPTLRIRKIETRYRITFSYAKLVELPNIRLIELRFR